MFQDFKIITVLFLSIFIISSCVGVDFKVRELSYDQIKESQEYIRSTNLDDVAPKTEEELLALFIKVTNRISLWSKKFCEQYADKTDSCEWDIQLVRNTSFNAYASDQNNIVVFSGLVNSLETESELAFVIAHEISHHIADHLNESFKNNALGRVTAASLGFIIFGSDVNIDQVSEIGGQLANFRFSRDQENEADLFALSIIYHAGYDLDEAKLALLRIAKLKDKVGKRSSFFDTHPSNPERIAYFDLHRDIIEASEELSIVN